MTTPLHPKKRYDDAARRLLTLLKRAHTAFLNAGMRAPTTLKHHSVGDSRVWIRWDPNRGAFLWRPSNIGPKTTKWRYVTGDINDTDMDRHDMKAVAVVVGALPALYDAAAEARDQSSDAMDEASDDMEAWLQDLPELPPLPIEY